MMSGLSALVMNIFLPSLPAMTEYFDTSYRLLQLSVAVYLGVNAVLQILIGPLSDKFGRRPVILWGAVIFCLATIGCLFSTNAYVFLLFRMCQAAIVTSMVLSRAVVRDIYPANQAASMIGYVTMGMSVVPMVGPVIGGMLGDAFGWKANFVLLLVLGIALIGLVWKDLGETKSRSSLSLRQQFLEYPELLASPRFWGYALSAALSSGSFFAYMGGAPFIGTDVFGLSPTELGLYFGAPAVGYFFGNWASGKYSARVGIDRMVLIGALVVALGLIVLAGIFALGAGSALAFFGLMTTVGLGNGLTIPNATTGALSVRPKLAGTASGLAGAIMIGGGAALSALAGLMLHPGTGAWPLIWIMLITSLCGILAILMVMVRSKRLGGLDAAD
ncbi:Bicyclomycin resistance protein [Pseudoprimorskyibacter insulae]|uniref:Bcr/CflA family efflux transporter n=2 Tax=Pseudoprimorskyibacter insulae TaxID=1695997 RepID=A0A2R8AQI6_9RHOB|nr:Bicyclomycin resistance protein [Pseudoprimorskyibacter insulae]